ncbi:hypothetical protein [Eleftheria terrae]|uniref:hypothetical protein n=1 Tax=Eleftheria terrae TaxID=1597781 RepID=UPI00263BB793|nr:hypothetical protein [Eleftheria terrae]WKB51622.1 hypothetical protein N7L95_17715 [Eleftheria terrae]
MHADVLAPNVDEAVFRRTDLGQREVLAASLPLEPVARRFLAVVNGHTPVRVLLALGFGGLDMQAHIEALSRAGLITLVSAD